MTTTINIIALVAWLLYGILNLLVYSDQEGVSKSSFTLCWLCLLVYIVGAIIQ